jgi:lipoyl(octanoyl) transferase
VKVLEAIALRELGTLPYAGALSRMKDFTARRTESTPDELWLVEHPAVYTLGQGASEASVANGIPVVRSDRGGEITYHGPGQVVLYALVDLARRGIKVKRFVWLLEQAVIDFLAQSAVRGERRAGAPGVYVEGAKVAALGIRVSRGRSTHGLSLNVDMDLAPFSAIDPCGYPGLRVTQLRDLGLTMEKGIVGKRLAERLIRLIDHE